MKITLLLVIVIFFIALIGCTPTTVDEDKELVDKEVKRGITFIESGEWGVEQASLSGDYIAYFDQSTDDLGDIFLYNIKSSEKKRITYDLSKQSYPKIKNNKIYWVDDRTNPASVWFYDLNTKEEEKTNLDAETYLLNEIGFCAPPHLISCPFPGTFRACYQNKCVKLKRGDSNLYSYDPITDAETKLEGTSVDFEKKDIYLWKNKIIWADNRNGMKNFDIFMYNIETKEETQITNTQDATESEPAIYGNLVAFLRCYASISSWSGSNTPCEVVLLDLNTGKETIIFNQWGSNIQIEENKVVWEGWKKSSNNYKDKIIFLYVT